MKKTLTGIALALMIGLGVVSAPTTAYAGGTEPEVTCEYAGYGVKGGVLKPGAHINLEYQQQGQTKQVNAYIDRNVQGGYDTLGIRINGYPAIPLTEAQVKTGAFKFDYAQYIDKSKSWKVLWAQFEGAPYFNQDRNPSKFLNCEGEVVVPEKPEPIVTVTHQDTVNCDTKVVTRTETTERTDWKLVDNVWLKDAPVITPTTSERPANTVDCPLPEIPDVGVNTAGLLWTLGCGLLMVGAGTALAVKRRKAES